MEHRGVMTVGFDSPNEFLVAVEKLDLDAISEIAAQKGFTVRDVDTLLQEMAAHDYYSKKGQEGLVWNTENFVRVLEHSVGSARTESTAELVLGDRFILREPEKIDNPQGDFGFMDDCKPKCNLETHLSKSKSEDSPFE